MIKIEKLERALWITHLASQRQKEAIAAFKPPYMAQREINHWLDSTRARQRKLLLRELRIKRILRNTPAHKTERADGKRGLSVRRLPAGP
jgi:hypothetical protein